MSRVVRLPVAVVVVVAALSACAPSREAAFAPVRERIEQRTGQRAEWREDDPRERSVDEVVARLLERELDLDSAAQVALLNSRALQARFEDVGIARARLVRATALANPTLSGEVLFPITADEVQGGVGVELDFLSSLFRGGRREVAVAELASTQLEVAADAVKLAFEARAALVAVLEATQRVAALERLVEASSLSDEVSARLREAGNVPRLSRLDQRAVAVEAATRLAEQRLSLVKARERLSRTLALAPSEWRTGQALPPLDDDTHPDLEERAVAQSLELEGMRRRIDAAGSALGLEDVRRFLPQLEIGARVEHEEGFLAGPSASIALPLVDLGQGPLAEREAELRATLERYAALSVDVRAEARRVQDELAGAKQVARSYTQDAVPLAEERLAEAVLQYNAMTLGVLDLLERARERFESEERQAAALARAWRLELQAEALLAGVRFEPRDDEEPLWGSPERELARTREEDEP